MTNPFSTSVGLTGVSSGTFPVLINDIAGVSNELVTALTRADLDTAVKVWAKVQRLGLEKLVSLIEGELSKSADFVYTKSQSGALTGKSDLLMLRAGKYVGYQIVATISGKDEIYIDSLHLDSGTDQDVNTTIKVFDPRGRELFTKGVTVKPDFNELSVGFATKARFGFDVLLFVGIDATGLGLSILGDGQQWGDSNVELSAAHMPVDSPHAWAQISSDSSTGVMIQASIRRSLSDVVARYEERLRWAYAYVCASLLMTEKLASPNFNLFTNTNRQFTEEQEAKLMDEAIYRMRPIARDMLKELSKSEVVTDKDNGPFDAGYTIGSFV